MGKRQRIRHPELRDPLLDAPVADSLDLHGLSQLEAQARLRDFLATASRIHAGGVVRIITGRGRGSQNGAVLKPLVERLLRGELRVYVADQAPDADQGSYLVRVK